MKRIIATIIIVLSIIIPYVSESGVLFHATKRSLAKKILKKGFNPKRMSKKARFGEGAYLSKSKKTALKEKPGSDVVVIFNGKKALKNKTIDINKLNHSQIKKISRDSDLRGNIHKGIIGPDLGRKIGNSAGKQGKVILYPSVRHKGAKNYFIPKKVYRRHPQIVTPKRILKYAE